MEASDIAHIKELECENSKLKQMYADLSLENLIIKEALEKKVLKPEHKRVLITNATKVHKRSLRKACKLFCISRTCYGYTAKPRDDQPVKSALLALATKKPT